MIIRLAFLFLIFPIGLFSQEVSVSRVEPPFWWTGFKNADLQLMIYGKNISGTTVAIDYPGLVIKKIHKVTNPNYLFLDLTVGAGTRPGIATILFKSRGNVAGKYLYELKARKKGSAERKGFSTSDVIYLLMPDRFANGDVSNDNQPGMVQQADRSDKDGRHGGDIKGISDHLDYIRNLGVTTLWINPLLENNQAIYSYHGYSTTDYY